MQQSVFQRTEALDCPGGYADISSDRIEGHWYVDMDHIFDDLTQDLADQFCAFELKRDSQQILLDPVFFAPVIIFSHFRNGHLRDYVIQ